ncbi:hypothetical protein B484DRAFT_450624 [Ochromonadaceae sp. CCMP2298]|nr:hypothetical protein B484DRAFT_450624 [Ochromonadaceae sp. CCMP2298]|mmetsp:Transcript_5574/g.12255  ORF Transcript_5574/g.12255 Transcript_5574/m.12255 type:complete len:1106 (-) Transcript_5574:54-3371(-)
MQLVLALLVACLAVSCSIAAVQRSPVQFGRSSRESRKKLLLRGGSTVDMVAPPLALSCAHWMAAEACLDSLQVSEVIGLSTEEAHTRMSRYGPNSLPAPPMRTLLSLVLEQFQDKLVQILLAVAALSGVLAAFENDLHAFAEPFIILSILVLNAFVGIWQSKSAEDSLDALKKLQPENACVLRDGAWNGALPASEIVPGDILYLRVGDRVPADARVIHLKTNTFSTDEGSLTGESMTVSKYTTTVDVNVPISGKTNMVFSGTMVTSGASYAVVTGTGTATEIGLINAGVQAAKEVHTKTPLGQRLDEFGNQLTVIIGVICVAVWVASIPKFSSPVFSSQFKGAVYYAKIAVALGVAAIPEGLPAIITLCLSLGTRRMAQRNVIVRKLASVETLGCTSVVCTDKTGTLTTNKMTVKALVTVAAPGSNTGGDASGLWRGAEEVAAGSSVALRERYVDGVSYDPVGDISNLSPETMLSPALQMVSTVCTLCNEAQLEYRDGQFMRVGEPTEAALKVLAEKLGAADLRRSDQPEEMVRQYNDHWGRQYSMLSMLEFNRDRKSMSVLVRPTALAKSRKEDNFLFVKGAFEMVIERCNRVQLEDGSIRPLTAPIRQQLVAKFQELARRPLRCLGLAFKQGEELGELNGITSEEEAGQALLLKDVNNYSSIESDMVFVGLCGITDPARPEAAEAILKCRKAGIRVMMITGDSKETAVAIAREVNIFDDSVDPSASAYTGQEFFALDPEVQLSLLQKGNKVFCRAEPRDKQRLISMLEKLDEIVAMTGDGVNDAPALQQAAIGIAMGITGTEVAKGAADMILADDNFSTIVSAVEEGRNIYSNMQTFVCFLISCNIGEVVTIFVATILGMPEPLTPLQLLWVNLVTDGPPATALGFNPSDPDAMSKQPRPRHESILSTWLVVRYSITGLYVGFATIGAFVWWYLDKGVSFSQLCNWGKCTTWPDFAHSAEAPNWPARPCAIFENPLRARPQSMSLSVLVCIEMLKALSAVSLDSSLLQVQPWQNPWLIAGVTLPMMLQMAALYFPPLSSMFGLAPLSWEEWKVVLKFSLPILLVEELLKLTGRHVEQIKQVALTKLKQAKELPQLARVPPPMF